MFFTYFQSAFSACLQTFALGAVGYFCVKRNVVDAEVLGSLSKLVVRIFFPVLMFTSITEKFSFSSYDKWWALPLISLAISGIGFLVSLPFSRVFDDDKGRRQFMTLIGFQNSGYLMLAFVASYLKEPEVSQMFILIFLFIIGFDLLIWSFGVHFLTHKKLRHFEFAGLFSPPVLAALTALAAVSCGLNRFIPQAIMNPFKILGGCALPLALFVVGGNLAEMRLSRINFKLIFLVVLAKLIIMPLLALAVLSRLNLPYLLGLLILLQCAMPPAVTPSIILKYYKRDDVFTSQGIFWGHIISILSIPFFLSLFIALKAVK